MSMTFSELQARIKVPVFSTLQAQRVFNRETPHGLRVQLSRFVRRGLITRLKQGLFQFSDQDLDELVIAAKLYQPSYISLETALSIHGLIPDIPAEITSITTVTTNVFNANGRMYRYSRIKNSLFFGFETVVDEKSGMSYQLAQPEKAVLDWIYLRKIKTLAGMRLSVDILDYQKLSKYSKFYPSWIRKVVNEQFSNSV